ncbi:MAG: hypothetical protein KC589_08165 [Nanoarchaeota archaeon]|nr:hypothetical protein [Nanoarchaeota archaeon]
MSVEVVTVPEKKGEEIIPKIKAVVEDRSRIIAKRFGMEVQDVEVRLYHNKGALVGNLGPNVESLGIFAGYVDHTNILHLIHPEAVGPVFGDNIDKEISILVDYTLTKFYLCMKYFPNQEDFRLFHKYISDSLADVSSGKLKKNMLSMEFKNYDPERKYKKDIELNMVLFVLREMGGIDSIYAHLDEIMKDMDIKKTLHNAYHKSVLEIIKPYKDEAEANHKALLQRFKPGRRR